MSQNHTKSLIFLGPGGVGKTSCSTAYALSLADKGFKVALLSIDPAKRLASSLNFKLGSKMQKVELSERSFSGELYASMLDQKTVFDQMINRFAKKEKTRKKIFAHPLYIAASTKLSGPLEYMAVAKFYDLVSSGEYDYVILDTPPDTNALDFLARPNVLGAFMDLGIIRILIKPLALANRFGLSKLFSAGESTISKIAKLTGIDALNILVDFIILCQEVIKGFHEVSQATSKIFKSNKCHFIYVSRLESRCYRSLKHMDKILKSLELNAYGCIFAKVQKKVKDSSMESQKKYLHSIKVKEKILDMFPDELKNISISNFSHLKEPLEIVLAMCDEFNSQELIIVR